MSERRKERKESRRKFLWQMGMGLAGFTGLSKLAKAMTGKPQPLAIPRCIPDEPVECADTQGYSCNQGEFWYHCHNSFTCPQQFTCGGSWTGDFKCYQEAFTCNEFNCNGSESGFQFFCETQFGCVIFNCDPGDHACPGGEFTCGSMFDDYTCSGNFVCNDFNCEAIADWGASFYCQNGFNCISITQQPFWCDPGDFYCGHNNNWVGYQCNGQPGAQYAMPDEPV